MLAPDRFSPWLTFCLLTQAVQHLPLERGAPLGGWEPSPAKRVREASLYALLGNPSQSARSTVTEPAEVWLLSLPKYGY